MEEMDISLKNPAQAKNQLDKLEEIASLAKNDSLMEVLLYTKANYYYTFNQQGICATTSRVLDLSFFGAFEEKNNFFKEHNDDACAVWNLAKWNRAIILKYRNEGASNEQRTVMIQQFRKNFKELCGYSQFKLKTLIYFRAFMAMPMVWSNLSEAIRNLKRDGKIRRYNKA